MLAAANAVTDADLVAGTTLKAPEVKTTANDANTFKPYDPNAILGPTTPSLPYITPPPKQGGGCNALATVIRVVVAIIVIAVTRNPYLAAAVAGIGETTAQTVEIQDGDRQGYNWGGVAMSAISAGIGAQAGVGNWVQQGVGTAAKAGRAAVAAAGTASVNYAGSYAINRALGEDVHFSWREMAANATTAAISAALFQSVSPRTGDTGLATNNMKTPAAFDWKFVAAEAVKSVVRQAISYGVRRAITGQAEWNWRGVMGVVAQDAATVAGVGLLSADGQKTSSRPIDTDNSLVSAGWTPDGTMQRAHGPSADELITLLDSDIVTLDTVTARGGDPEAWWRYDFNTWAQSGGYAQIRSGSSNADARQTYYEMRAVNQAQRSTYLQRAYQGQTVSVDVGTPISSLTRSQSGNQLLLRDLRGVGRLAVGTLKAAGNEIAVSAQAMTDALRQVAIPLNPLAALLPSVKSMNGGQYYAPFVYANPTEKAGETMFAGVSLVTGVAGFARLAMARSAVGLARVANGAEHFVDLSRAGDLVPGLYRGNPQQIRFGQHLASPNFSTGGTINDTVVELLAGKSPDLIGDSPIRVVFRDGVPFTLDNRRLIAFNAAGVDNIPFQVVSTSDPAIATLLRNPTRMNPIGGEGRYIVVAPRADQVAARQLLLENGLIK